MPKKIDEKVEIKKEGELWIVDERYVNEYTKEEMVLAYKNFLAKKQNLEQQMTTGVEGVKKEMAQLKKMIDAMEGVKDSLEGQAMQQYQGWIQQYNNYEKMMNPEVLKKQEEDIKNITKRLDEIREVASEIMTAEKKEERKNPQQAKAKKMKPKQTEHPVNEDGTQGSNVEVEKEEPKSEEAPKEVDGEEDGNKEI